MIQNRNPYPQPICERLFFGCVKGATKGAAIGSVALVCGEIFKTRIEILIGNSDVPPYCIYSSLKVEPICDNDPSFRLLSFSICIAISTVLGAVYGTFQEVVCE